MADEGFKRKLTAILSADVEGYSRLMGNVEDTTVHTIHSYYTKIDDKSLYRFRKRLIG